MINKNITDILINENNIKLLNLQKLFFFDKMINIKTIDNHFNTKTSLVNITNKLYNKTNDIKNIFKLYIIMIKLNKLHNNNNVNINFIVNKNNKNFNENLYVDNIKDDFTENNILKVISTNNKVSVPNLKNLTNYSIKQLNNKKMNINKLLINNKTYHVFDSLNSVSFIKWKFLPIKREKI